MPSSREFFMRTSADLNIYEDAKFEIAETYKDWKSEYKSLSVFQGDIAALSTAVVIFPETEGSLVELGMFFENLKTRRKLIVATDFEYIEEDSFIRHGIFDPLRTDNEAKMLGYSVPDGKPEMIAKPDMENVLVAVFEFAEESEDSEAFDLEDFGHIIKLIYQTVHFAYAITIPEIRESLAFLGVIVEEARLKQVLYTLGLFGMVNVQQNLKQRFFYATSLHHKRIEFSGGYYEDRNKKTKQYRFEYLRERIAIRGGYNKIGSTSSTNSNRLSVINWLEAKNASV